MNTVSPISNDVYQDCESVQAEFSAYLDGTLSGVKMASLAAHLNRCATCAWEFAALRSVQTALGELKPVPLPTDLQRQLRAAVSIERQRGTYLSVPRRALAAWNSYIGPAAFRFAGGLIATLIVAAGMAYIFGAPSSVQANDDRMAHLISPHYLYSQVPPQPINAGRDVPILVQAKINAQGRAYDYIILDGPDNPKVRLQVEENLLSSVFKPATVFGVPVRGQVVLTYTTLSVHG